ncbi:hypothetical protein BD309DRAFT_874754 [Dichomitus squalens]|uniref:Uncharacterized protein n=1 Tax=Dichomitus squalens TaxID=114155 RepID=A0A4Q9NBK2_9APHY|nr:hypothetical protein BD309DRAFT_874754 [Dichomitus squalens]TBU59649.1 hypothetical protein BD310DRAFT_816937 [Dichomitus squalens]
MPQEECVPLRTPGDFDFQDAYYWYITPPPRILGQRLTRVMSSLPSIDDTLGAVFIGTYISLVLYGLALHQAYLYYVNYPYDKRWLKIYVSNCRVLELVCTVLTCHMCYYYGVSNYADPTSLGYIVWSTVVLAIVGALMVVFTQCFFLHRVWLIGRQYRPVAVIAFMFMMLELSVCFAYAVDALRLKTWDGMTPRVWFVSVHTSASAVADLLITWVLIYTLRQNQKRGMQRTNDMINDLILYSVSTGKVYNIVCFILSLALPQTLLYWATVMVGLKLYSNSLLAALNSRRSISARHPAGVTDTSPFGVSIRPLDSIELSHSAKHTSQMVTSWNVRSLAGRDDTQSTSEAGDNGIAVKITKEVVREPSESDLKRTEDV